MKMHHEKQESMYDPEYRTAFEEETVQALLSVVFY